MEKITHFASHERSSEKEISYENNLSQFKF